MNCETELVDLGLSLKQKTYLGIITCKFMAYDCGLNLIRFFAAVNISLLARATENKSSKWPERTRTRDHRIAIFL